MYASNAEKITHLLSAMKKEQVSRGPKFAAGSHNSFENVTGELKQQCNQPRRVSLLLTHKLSMDAFSYLEQYLATHVETFMTGVSHSVEQVYLIH